MLKELKITLEEVNLGELIQILGEYQRQLYESNNCWIKFHFNWENATTEYVKLKHGTEWFKWLYPIKFTSTLAFILEIMQNNINYILLDREKVFEIICAKLKINLDDFYSGIAAIQELLIEFGKVKVCKDGKVVIMNDVW